MYEKLMAGKVMKLSEKDGLTVELTRGKDNNVLSIWGMYKNAEGEWAYKGTASGATAIRLPMNEEVVNYLVSQLAGALEVDKKSPFPKKSSEVVTKKMSDLTVEELEAMLAKKKAATAKATTKEVVKKTPAKAEIDLDDLDELASVLLAKLQGNKKTTKK